MGTDSKIDWERHPKLYEDALGCTWVRFLRDDLGEVQELGRILTGNRDLFAAQFPIFARYKENALTEEAALGISFAPHGGIAVDRITLYPMVVQNINQAGKFLGWGFPGDTQVKVSPFGGILTVQRAEEVAESFQRKNLLREGRSLIETEIWELLAEPPPIHLPETDFLEWYRSVSDEERSS